MKIAICLFKYFPFGGLQRDFMRIARECVKRGHEVHVYAMQWEGEREPSLQLHLISVKGLSNHARARSFSEQVEPYLNKGDYDVVMGFNKMPHLDLYYAADVCYQARIKAKRSFLYRWSPRYRSWKELEQKVFDPEMQTNIMLLSQLQQAAYADTYGTSSDRFHLLPPGIARDRIAPANAESIRHSVRARHHLPQQDYMLLMVGSGYQTKGLDRAIIGLAHLPEKIRQTTHLFVIGQGNATRFNKLAERLGVTKNVNILGPRNDVPDYLLAADLLLHPSYHENTGTAILEALAAGLPVLTTEVCGYAHYVTDADAGTVLLAPYEQQKWDRALEKMLSSGQLKVWGQNGLAFAKTADIYDMPQHATDYIENWVKQRDFTH